MGPLWNGKVLLAQFAEAVVSNEKMGSFNPTNPNDFSYKYP
jgi:hypothetical protein